ncbi:MAG: hypothetical protein CSA64_03845 [Arachnia propionica]|nr:MAG: hypothetical protein CSA64_03845 [Arachnia propionica]
MSDTQAKQATVEDLVAQLKALQDRVDSLESQLPIPEADLVAIGAAVAAYLGYEAKVRAIRYRRPTGNRAHRAVVR